MSIGVEPPGGVTNPEKSKNPAEDTTQVSVPMEQSAYTNIGVRSRNVVSSGMELTFVDYVIRTSRPSRLLKGALKAVSMQTTITEINKGNQHSING